MEISIYTVALPSQKNVITLTWGPTAGTNVAVEDMLVCLPGWAIMIILALIL